MKKVSCSFAGKSLVLESGRLARQANGSVFVSYGDTQVLATVCVSPEPTEGINFVPLTVEFAERFYAAGKIPGSFHKREGRPTSEATLSARLIDRAIRPLFHASFHHETQVILTVFSLDVESDVDVAASIAVSAALHLSDVPFYGPTVGCRVGFIDNQFVLNPSWPVLDSSQNSLDLFVVSTQKAVMMVEGTAKELSEEKILEAIMYAHQSSAAVIELIHQFRLQVGKPKRDILPSVESAAIKDFVLKNAFSDIQKALQTKDKAVRYQLLADSKKQLALNWQTQNLNEPSLSEELQLAYINRYFDDLVYDHMREMILSQGVRIDGRALTAIRDIQVEVGVLTRPHGSALFTRGETQVLSTVTLGTAEDEQIVDTMHQKAMRRFMLHYNFPPFCVGEVGRLGNQSRREIGHGALAEKSIKAMMPAYEDFPYTIRVVCETLESNGSSSMASVCSTSMALMYAGVPFQKAVAGIAMGLIKQEEKVAILSDILGDEDHLGDMDFKVAGTAQGITGIQMDIKVEGVDEAILTTALAQAKKGRIHILEQMSRAIQQPQNVLSKYAPRIHTLVIPVDKIRDVIGSGGKVIKDIILQTGCKIDIQDDGKISIASADGVSAEKAIEMIRNLTADVEVNKVYKGLVKKIADFGAFIGILPNQDGLLHISEIAHERVHRVEDFLKEGDTIEVKVLEVDKTTGKIRLSRKVLLDPPEGALLPEKAAGQMKRKDHRPKRRE